MKYCIKCGKALDDEVHFCPACGTPCADTASNEAQNETVNGESTSTKASGDGTVTGWFDKVTGTINRLAGGSGAIRPPLKSIFSEIFKKHKTSDAEEIFTCGTAMTTPQLSAEGKAWPHPWLWTRILLAFGAAFLLLHLCCTNFGNTNTLPGVIFLGSFMIPIAFLVFFFEMNTPKNISFFTILKYFLVGGCASLLVTLFLNDVINIEGGEYLNAVLTGIIEESAKLAIVALVIHLDKNAKYALNGLLIGAAIGAGFAAFESAGYAFNIFVSTMLSNILNENMVSVAYGEMTENIFLRALLAPGGHIAWAAIAGYSVMLVKGDKKLTMSFLNKTAFWKIFWIPIALHAVWDMPIALGNTMAGVLIIKFLLVALAWLVLFVLIGNSLSQIGAILMADEELEES